jgi:hypothetical protein
MILAHSGFNLVLANVKTQSQHIVLTKFKSVIGNTFSFDVIKFQNCLHALAKHLTLKFQNGTHKLKAMSVKFNFDVLKFQNGTVGGVGGCNASVPQNLKHPTKWLTILTGCCKEWYFSGL